MDYNIFVRSGCVFYEYVNFLKILLVFFFFLSIIVMNKKQGVIIMTMAEMEAQEAAWERLQATPLDKIVNKGLGRTLTAEEIKAVKWWSEQIPVTPDGGYFYLFPGSRERAIRDCINKQTHSFCECANVPNIVEDYKRAMTDLHKRREYEMLEYERLEYERPRLIKYKERVK